MPTGTDNRGLYLKAITDAYMATVPDPKQTNYSRDEIMKVLGLGILGGVKEVSNDNYTMLDLDGYSVIIFRNLSANKKFNFATHADNIGRGVLVINESGTYSVDCIPEELVDAATNLNEDLDISETGVDVQDGTKFSANDVIKIENEEMYVVSIVTNTLTVIRAYNDTTAATHANGLDIYKRTVKINGYYGIVQITEKMGWWYFYADSTEWKGITDGKSTKLEFKNSSACVTTSNQGNQWLGFTPSHQLTVPPGTWDIGYDIGIIAEMYGSYLYMYACLFTVNCSVPDLDFEDIHSHYRNFTGYYWYTETHHHRLVPNKVLVSPTTYYFNVYWGSDNALLYVYTSMGSNTPSYIRAWRRA